MFIVLILLLDEYASVSDAFSEIHFEFCFLLMYVTVKGRAQTFTENELEEAANLTEMNLF